MKRRITLDLDEELIRRIDRLCGQVSESRASFIVASVDKRMKADERERLDAQFARMAADPACASEIDAVEREMAPASDEAWSFIDRTADAPLPNPQRRVPASKRKGARRGAR